jgi:hypothetical protein
MTLLTDSLAALLWVGAAILLVLGVHRAASRLMPPPSAPVLARAEGERRAARYRGTVP